MTVVRNHREFLNLAKRFTSALLDEAEHRDERQELLPSGEFAWTVHEIEFMRDLVNTARAERGLGPVAAARIADVESSAAGHSDYPHKFGLYCAEIVFEEDLS
ncbi:hypothetical protein ACT17_23105 [Mycolicibacterium conceptionense]|uniref:Uncharacterized protein n=1 Tax=Mycolicibacterium conceptionense TaxID=451644 RepID=A0A0J8U388_9MYCO|nr:hypothetical protein [Mycolicibacterium conceptionense]KMV15981.1 hypothetical protein ACT17_23105 [Mycolicibacterium conceptionense]